jgi:hypothetical protein
MVTKKIDRQEMKRFLDELRLSKKTERSAGNSSDADRDLTIRISEAIKDFLDVQGVEEGRERSETEGFQSMRERMLKNRDVPQAAWALSQYDALPVDRAVTVDRSMIGSLLLKDAASFDHIVSYLTLVGFNGADAERAMARDIWSDERGRYVQSSVSSMMTYAAGVYAYAVSALEERALEIFGPDSVRLAGKLKTGLGGLDAMGEAACFGFNRGWVFAKTVSEKIEHRSRGRKSREQVVSNMEVDREEIRRQLADLQS